MEITYDIDALESTAKKILNHCKNETVYCFDASMGAGKTTLIKALAIELGAKASDLSSPTFGIVNEYKTKDKTLFHFDLYRLKTHDELHNIGFYDYINTPNSICFIEWPELAFAFLQSCTKIAIEPIDSTQRRILIEKK
jgi:tRNA threonylcarbamoyladenosine biosynthesis protein TsaE